MNNIRDGICNPQSRASGFSLVETVLAIAVVAVTFVGIIGLLGLGAASDQNSSQQTSATNIAASIIADLRSTPNYTAASPRYNLTLPTASAALSSVTPTILYFDNTQNVVATSTGAAFCAYIYLTQSISVGTSPKQATDLARIVVFWPAQTTTTPTGNVDILTQFRIN